MIEVTRLNGTTVLINSDLIETVEETPDTVISRTLLVSVLMLVGPSFLVTRIHPAKSIRFE